MPFFKSKKGKETGFVPRLERDPDYIPRVISGSSAPQITLEFPEDDQRATTFLGYDPYAPLRASQAASSENLHQENLEEADIPFRDTSETRKKAPTKRLTVITEGLRRSLSLKRSDSSRSHSPAPKSAQSQQSPLAFTRESTPPKSPLIAVNKSSSSSSEEQDDAASEKTYLGQDGETYFCTHGGKFQVCPHR